MAVVGIKYKTLRRISIICYLLILFTINFFMVESTIGSPTILTVSKDGNSSFETIQEAINAASPGDTIQIEQGRYHENLHIDIPLKLNGNDKSLCIIDGNGANGIIISSPNVSIFNCTIENCSIGVYINSTYTTVKNCTFYNNDLGISTSIIMPSSSIYLNNFANNTQNARDTSDNGSYWNSSTVGNYWDDYIGSDGNNDGIGDSLYNISGGMSIDAHPLIKPLSLDPVTTYSFDPAYPSTDDTIVFTDNSSDDEGIISWNWDFGDGNGSTIQNPKHSYADNGLYNVTLTVSDIFGLTDSYTRVIPVRNVPPTCNFVFSPSQPTDIQTVFFQDDSTDNDGSIINWNWDFGENNTYYTDNVTFQFPDNGTYHVLLIVTDDDGATSSHTAYIHVLNAIPTPSFTYNSMNGTYLEGDQIQFSDHSFDQDGTVVSWSWDLGDGTTSAEKQPVHTYQKQGTYTVTLSVVDNDGGIGISAKSIKIVATVEGQDWNTGINILDYAFIIFILVMVTVVFLLSRKYMKI